MVSPPNLCYDLVRLACDCCAQRCWYAGYVVEVVANLWDGWELVTAEKGGIRRVVPNIAHGRLRGTSPGLIRNHR